MNGPRGDDIAAQTATAASYTASAVGLGIGGWLQANWLSVLSAIFIVLTFFVQLYYASREERRRNERHDRDMHK